MEVRAEEANDEEDEKDSNDSEGGTNSNYPLCFRTGTNSHQVRKKKRTRKREKRKAATMTKKKNKNKKRKKKNPRIQNQNSLNVRPNVPGNSILMTVGAMNHSCPAEKHHFDACAARVAKAEENPEEGGHHGHPEDCAEEFLHLMHCVDKTIAEPLFRQLK